MTSHQMLEGSGGDAELAQVYTAWSRGLLHQCNGIYAPAALVPMGCAPSTSAPGMM